MKNIIIGILLGTCLTFTLGANAGFLGSVVGGAGGAALATAGIDSKIDTINIRIEALTRAIDASKICKGK